MFFGTVALATQLPFGTPLPGVYAVERTDTEVVNREFSDVQPIGFVDTEGGNISDDVILDDDNDGVLDEVENPIAGLGVAQLDAGNSRSSQVGVTAVSADIGLLVGSVFITSLGVDTN